MNGVQALVEYGYVREDDGTFRKGRKGQSWKPVEGGFLRYDWIGGAEQPMPFTLKSEFNGVSGLTHVKNSDCYVWVWPEEELDKIYVAAKIAEDERLAIRLAEKTQLSVPEVVIDEPVTEAEVARMVESQNTEVKSKRRWWNR